MPWTLRRKLITSITPIVALAIGLLAAASYHSGAAAISSQMDELLMTAVERTDASLEAWIKESLRDASILAQDDAVLAACRTGRVDEAMRRFKSYHRLSPDYENIFLATKDGRIIADSLDGKSIGVEIGKLDDYRANQEASSRGEVHIGDVRRSPVTGRPVSLITTPVFDGDKVAGIVGTPVELTVFGKEFVANARVGRTGYLFALDAKGVVAAHSDADTLLRDVAGESFVRTMLAKPEGVLDYVWKGVDKRLAWKLDPATKWTLAATIEKEEFSQEIVRFAWMSFGLGLLTIVIIAVALSVVATRSVTRPLAEVVKAADAIAAGDFTHELRLAERDDEVGALARAFQRMTASLRSIATTFEAVASGDLRAEFEPQSERDLLGNALVRMLGNIKALTRQSQEAVQVLAASISQISAAASQLSSSSAETATALTQTSATVEEVKQTASLSSQKARVVADVARKAAQAAQAGRASTRDIGQAMRLISAKMDAISAHIARLSEKSQLIGEIITAVGEVADQSNILAVNAAIEASRAGEEGKGFAVVAREIRLLADQSKQSTNQVREILQEIQTATVAAVMAAEQGGGAVKSGEKQTEATGQSIEALGGSVDESYQAAAHIAASIQEQLAGVEQVALAMDNIREASDQNLRGVSQLDGSVHDLNKLAAELRRLLEFYKT